MQEENWLSWQQDKDQHNLEMAKESNADEALPAAFSSDTFRSLEDIRETESSWNKLFFNDPEVRRKMLEYLESGEFRRIFTVSAVENARKYYPQLATAFEQFAHDFGEKNSMVNLLKSFAQNRIEIRKTRIQKGEIPHEILTESAVVLLLQLQMIIRKVDQKGEITSREVISLAQEIDLVVTALNELLYNSIIESETLPNDRDYESYSRRVSETAALEMQDYTKLIRYLNSLK